MRARTTDDPSLVIALSAFARRPAESEFCSCFFPQGFMTTISQLPAADAVSSSDLIPISQGGLVHAVSVGSLLAQTQPAIMVNPPSLLGRISLGPGGPDSITVGNGLTLADGTLRADNFDLDSLSLRMEVSPSDQLIVTNSGTMQLAELGHIRSLFTAGPNIAIDEAGVISASGTASVTPYRLSGLPPVVSLTPGDLVGISQAGEDHTIPFVNLLDGLTIDLAQPAGSASDGDLFWVAQTGNVMVRQAFGAIWSWISGKLRTWKRPVIELSVNAVLDALSHNNAVLICSSPVLITAGTSDLGSGFSCTLINASPGQVTFSGNIVTSNGTNALGPNQSGVIHSFTYSGGATVFASIGGPNLATIAPGQAIALGASTLTSNGLVLSWSPPASGGAVSTYIIRYRVAGSAPWLQAGQNNGSDTFTISGLQAATTYEFSVVSSNNVGTGPASSTFTAATLAGAPPPSAPTAVTVTSITANGMTVSWAAPADGGTDMTYAVQYRVSGQSTWNSVPGNILSPTVLIASLIPGTSYDVQIIASNESGSSPPSVPITSQTARSTGLVTSITWNLVPIGSFTHGTGWLGVNAHVNPGTAPVQFGFSLSLTSPPTSWLTGTFVNTDLWGAYVATPPTPGPWYVWAEGTDGSSPTVYATPITIT